MFDLPLPLGPTITLTPGVNVSRVRSGNDLNPFRLIAFRYISGNLSSARFASEPDVNAAHP
jgi:hypothetical protein